MVTKPQIQEQIAKVLGMRMATDEEAAAVYGNVALPYRPWINSSGDCARLPNWPTDRNASYELPVEDDEVEQYIEAHAKFIRGSIGWDIIDTKDLRDSARIESLAWLLYKGWQWVEHEKCNGTGAIEIDEGDDYASCECNGDGGKWVQVL